MHGKCNLLFDFYTSESGFSFDELVMRVSESFNGPNGFSNIISMMIALMQEVLISRMRGKNTLSNINCCHRQHLHLHDCRKRTLTCSLGKVNLKLWRVRCTNCGKTQLIFSNWLKFPASYSRKSSEFEKIVIEAVAGTSYRRASVQLVNNHLPLVPKSTMHDWLLATDCDEIKFAPPKQQPLKIFADGTYANGSGQNGKAVKRDIKVMLGVDQENRIFPIGTYVGKTWKEISEQLKKDDIHFPKGSVLIADGELGLAESFAKYVDEVQRCQWHIDHDLYHMCRIDGKLNEFSSPLRRELRHIMGIELPSEDYQKVPDAQKSAIVKEMTEAEAKVESLISRMHSAGCVKAAQYLEKAKYGMFGYVRRWLRFGIVCPRASSMIERVMRELGRRLKRIAYGWSAKGAEKMAKIILRKFTQQQDWNDFWKAKTKTEIPGFMILFNQKIAMESSELT